MDQDDLDGRLRDAAAKGAMGEIEWLILAGADPNASTVLGETALHFAAKNNHHDAVTFLIDKGANPTIKDQPWHANGDTPDLVAKKYGHNDLAQRLLKYKDAFDSYSKSRSGSRDSTRDR